MLNKKQEYDCAQKDRERFSLSLRLVEGAIEEEECIQYNEMSHFVERLTNTLSSVNKEQLFIEGCDRVYLRGIAGIGKTSFVEHLTLSWARGKIMDEFDFVFLLRCRMLVAHRSRGMTVANVFQDFFNLDVWDMSRRVNGERILIVIDGLDELPSLEAVLEGDRDDSLSSVLNSLLNKDGPLFPGHKCIFTGRPHINSLLRKYEANTIGKMSVVEITGFDQKTVELYVENFTSGDATTKNAILDKINSNESLRVIATVPQFLSSLCSILANQKTTLRTYRLTELYIWILVSFIRQHLAEFKEMPYQIFTNKRFQNFLAKITHISYKLLLENKIIFKTGELSDLLATDDEIERKMIDSFVVRIETPTECLYQFKHVSLQEFLAAIFCFDKGTDINFLLDKKMYVTMEFVAGLARAEQCFIDKETSISSIFVECLFQEKKSTEFLLVGGNLHDITHSLLKRLTNRHIGWRPFFSIFFELFHEKDKLPEAVQLDCEIDFLFDSLSVVSGFHFVHFLQVLLDSFGEDALSSIRVGLMKTSIAQQLGMQLVSVVPYVHSFKCIACDISYDFLQLVSKSIETLGVDSKLKRFAFSKCNLSDAEVQCLLHCVPHVERLELSHNDISVASVSVLATRVTDYVDEYPALFTLKELVFHGCNFLEDSVSHLCRVIPHLVTLDLTNCMLNEKQVDEIVESIANCDRENANCKIEKLMLERCYLNENCIQKLCKVIPHLRFVNISRSATAMNQQEFGSEVAEAIIRSIEFAFFDKKLRLQKLIMHSFSTDERMRKKFLALKRLGIEVSFKVWNRHSLSKASSTLNDE